MAVVDLRLVWAPLLTSGDENLALVNLYSFL